MNIRNKFSSINLNDLRNLSYFMSVPLTISIVSFIMTPVLTSFISPDEFSIIGLFLSVVALFSLFSIWSSNTIITKDYYKKPGEIPILMSTSILIISFVTFIMLLILVCYDLSEIFSISSMYLYLGIISSFFMSIATLLKSKLQISQQAKIWAFISLVSFFVPTFFLVISIIMDLDVFSFRVGTLILANIISLVVCLFFFKSIDFSYPTIDSCKYVLFKGFPLLLIGIVFWLELYLDRFIVNAYVDSTSAGLYMFAITMSSPLLIFITTVNRVLSPKCYQILASGNIIEVVYLCLCSLIVFSLISLFYSIFMSNILKYIVDDSYFGAIGYVTPISLVIILGFINSMLQPLIHHFKLEYLYLVLSVIFIIMLVGFLYLFIPSYQVYGAILSKAISLIILITSSLMIIFFKGFKGAKPL